MAILMAARPRAYAYSVAISIEALPSRPFTKLVHSWAALFDSAV